MHWVIGALGLFLVISAAFADTNPRDASCCDSDWRQMTDSDATKCFKVFPTRLTWTAAKDACTAQNGRLISIHSAFANQFVYSEVRRVIPDGGALYGSSDGVWLGGKTYSPAPNNTADWFWLDGTNFQNYMNWDQCCPTQPDNGGTGESCLEMFSQGSRGGYWNDLNDGYTLPYVCEKQTSGSNCVRKQ